MKHFLVKLMTESVFSFERFIDPVLPHHSTGEPLDQLIACSSRFRFQ